MQIEIPDDLYETFTQFLDVAQASFTEEEVEAMTEIEKKVIKWIEDLLGEKKSGRYETQAKYVEHITETFKVNIGMDESEEENNADKKT